MNGEAYISGVGQSEVGVRLTRKPLLLTLDAINQALQEAGLSFEQIDGVASYPGRCTNPPGFSPLAVTDVIDALGIKPRWYMAGVEFTSQLGAIVAAADAVRAGHARHVICFRTIYEAAAIAQARRDPVQSAPQPVSGDSQWLMPFNAMSTAHWVAQYAMRHVKRYGLTRTQLGQVAINAHANAALNPNAIVRKPLTLDAYMSSRMITSPLCLYDCDRFTDASTVLIVSAGNALDEISCVPVRIAAAVAKLDDRWSWDQADWMACYATGPELWNRSDYTPDDVDIAQIYDGFSFLTLTWLESLGFCGIGEGGQFLEGGKRIARDGELPLNTSGGQLGVGRLHGFGFAHEAAVQLRGKGGARQISGEPKVAVVTNGGGPQATAMLLTRD